MRIRQQLLIAVVAAMVCVMWMNMRLATVHVVSLSSDLARKMTPTSSINSRGKGTATNTTMRSSGGGKSGVGANRNSNATHTKSTMMTNTTRHHTKILGFADGKYVDYAVRWYRRLESLGYTEMVIVTVDQAATEFFSQTSQQNPRMNWEALPYQPCVSPQKDQRLYRRQLFGRRWKYVQDQLKQGYHVLLTDVDNVFSRLLPMSELEESPVDVYHAYSTSYPVHVFEDMGLTVCGGMSWLRAVPSVIRFVGSLVNQCKCTTMDPDQLCKECYCDDQVVLNELLWKGKHQVEWNRSTTTLQKRKPLSLKDFPWRAMNGISNKTRHRIHIWDRNVAYRAEMPKSCPPNNWVAMPLYVDRSEVVEKWNELCSGGPPPS